MEFYVIINTTSGKYIDVDSHSGGYPYEVEHILRANKFIEKEDAEHYKKICDGKTWVIKRAVIALEDA